MNARLRLAVACTAAAATLAMGAPAQAAPPTASTSHTVVADPGDGRDGFRSRGDFRNGFRPSFRHHRFRFPFVTPFYGGGFYRDRFGCAIFLELGDVQSFYLCQFG